MAHCNLPECQVDHKVDKATLKEHNRIAENRLNHSSRGNDYKSMVNTSNSFAFVPDDIDEDDLEDYYYDQAERELSDVSLEYGTIYYEGYEPSGGKTGSQDFLLSYSASKAAEEDDSNSPIIVSFQIPGGYDEDVYQANKDYLEDYSASEKIKSEVDGDRYKYTFDNFEQFCQNKHSVVSMGEMITGAHEDYPILHNDYYNNIVGEEEDDYGESEDFDDTDLINGIYDDPYSNVYSADDINDADSWGDDQLARFFGQR